MGWTVAVDAEIAGRAHDAFAEMVLPEAIHHHASGQRIRGGGNPFGQSQPASGASADERNFGRFVAACYGLQESWLYTLTAAREIAARENVGRCEVGNLRRHHIRDR